MHGRNDDTMTIYELSEKIGYSVSTISKAINGYKGVNEDTRAAILAAVKQYDFIPSINAQSLLSKRSYVIGTLILDGPNDILSPHLSEILNAFKSECANHGYDITFLSNRIGKKEVTYREHCIARNLDGLLLAVGMENLPPERTKQFEDLLQLSMPKVSVEGFHKGVPTVISNNSAGAQSALDYLYELGHRNIGIITVAGENEVSIQRLNGYRQFLKKHTLPECPERIFPARSYSYEAGEEIADAVSSHPELTAVFCIYDEISLGLIAGLRRRGIEIPRDLSLVSFDDIAVAQFSALTTVHQNRERIGMLAAKKLISLIEHQNAAPHENTLVDTALIVRKSCRDISRSL